jgi:hypothetical protein
VLNDPANLIDPTGQVLPIVLGAIVLADVLLTVADIISLSQVLLDPCASTTDKLFMTGLTLVGVALPVGGFAAVAKGARQGFREARHIEDLMRQAQRPKKRTKLDEFYDQAFPDGAPQVVPQGRASGPPPGATQMAQDVFGF